IAQRWMAEGVYRYYSSQADRTIVEGLCACFCHPNLKEPLCAFAQIRYRDEAAKGICQEWDIWRMALEHNADLCLNKLLIFDKIEDGRIASAKVIVVPLYSIQSMAEVDGLMGQVRGAASKSTAGV